MNYFLGSILGLACGLATTVSWAACRDDGVQLQVLGSGGPGHAAGRASTAYVLWQDGESRFMVDAGSGSKDQFHQAGADLEQIRLLALSHLHPDHSAELPAILWPFGAAFALAGPTAGNGFPSVQDFIAGMIGPGGVYPVLNDRVDLDIIEVDVSGSRVSEVWRQEAVRVRGRSVPHGNVPAIGYRFEFNDKSIAFASDQNGSDPGFIDFIDGADILVIHLAAQEDSTGLVAELHAKPSVWGQMASRAEVGEVVVSHISTSSDQVLQQSLAILRDNYAGPVTVAEDLLCIELD